MVQKKLPEIYKQLVMSFSLKELKYIIKTSALTIGLMIVEYVERIQPYVVTARIRCLDQVHHQLPYH
jgi:hypothetical protein